MPKTVSDSELAARVRRQNRAGSQRRREKQRNDGKAQLGGLWIPEATKQHAMALAAQAGVPLSMVVTLALDRLNDIDATAYLLASPANAARLLSAVADHRAGQHMQAKELISDDD